MQHPAKIHPSIETASDSMPALSDSQNPNDDREPDDPQQQGLETPMAQRYDPDRPRPWTPEPEPYDPETYSAWGREHFGEDWFEQRKTMLEERNIYINHDQVYKERQRALRVMERDRQMWRLPPKGKTWQELTAWTRMHYGDFWYQLREAVDQLERKEEDISDPDELRKIMSKGRKHQDIMRDIQLDKDEGMLAEGKTWHDIMALPVRPSDVAPSIETSSHILLSPSPSSDGSGYNTYPPTPTETRIQAQNGPSGPEHEWEWRQELLEWRAVHDRWTENEYEQSKRDLRASIRSSLENEDGVRRRKEELAEIQKIRFSPGTFMQSDEYDRRMRYFNLRAKGMTPEQIDAEERERAVHARQYEAYIRTLPLPPTTPSIPMTQEDMEAKRRAWDSSGISKERQAELIRKFGIHVRPSADGHAENEAVSQSQASPPRPAKDSSRKASSGRVTKTVPQRQRGRRRARQSRHSALIYAESLPPDRRRDPSNLEVLEELGDNTQTAPKGRKIQRKTHEEEERYEAVAAAPSPPQPRPRRGRKARPTPGDAAEPSESPGPRRSARIAHIAKRARQVEVAAAQATPIKTMRPRKDAPDKAKKPQASSIAGIGDIPPAPKRGRGRPLKDIPPKASKPQGIIKRGRPRKKS